MLPYPTSGSLASQVVPPSLEIAMIEAKNRSEYKGSTISPEASCTGLSAVIQPSRWLSLFDDWNEKYPIVPTTPTISNEA